PIVPMFHANAWGLPYAAALAGSKLVLPGPRMDPADLDHLIDSEKVTFSGAVPTIWQGIAQLEPPPDLSSMERIVCGGSAVLENAIMAHPEVLEAAVIAMSDERWGERPCACVVRREGSDLAGAGLREFLGHRVAKWWLPDRVEFIGEVPKTSVGKFDKKVLRARFAESGEGAEQPASSAAPAS